MFDLFRSRQKAVRILLGGLLTIVALSMLVYLIPGAGTPTGDRNDQVIAEIGKDVLTVRDVELQVQQDLKSRNVPPDLVQVLIPQRVDEMIAEYALAYEAKRLGFEITDQQLAKTLLNMPQIGSLTPQQYKDWIEQQMQESVAEFEEKLRRGLHGNELEQIAIEGSVVTPAEVDAEFRRRNEKIKVDYITFDPAKLSAEVKPSNDELKAYYDKNKAGFIVPETRSVQAIVADMAKVAESIQVPDVQILAYYNSHKDQYRTPERVKARHILLSTTGKPKDDVPKIKAKADDLLKQIKAGADFAKLAEKNSEDPGSASKGGDLGWVVRGQMVKNFEDTVFSLKPNEISNVVTTEYGFHIIQVTEKEQARLRSLDEVKPEIVGTLRNQIVFDRLQAVADQARAELVKAPQNAQQIATKLNLEFVTMDKYKQGFALPQVGADPQVSGTLMSMKKGEVSQVLQAGNKLLVAEVTNIVASHPGDFSEVDTEVRARYAQEKGMTVASDKAKKAGDLLKANGGDLKAAAKAVGLEVKTTDFFNRSASVEGIGTASYLGDSFDKPIGTVIGPFSSGTQTAVAKIVDRQSPDMSKLAQERDTIVTQLKGKKSGERQVLFRDSILSKLVEQGKIKKHQDVINRLIARYRS